MPTIDDVIQAVTDESTVDDSIITLLQGDTSLIASLKQQLADALSGVTLPAGVQAKIDAVFAQAQANAQKISDAVTANTQS